MEIIPILFVTDSFTVLAGAERNLYEIVSRLNRDRYKPAVICLSGGVAKDELGDIEIKDLQLHRIYGWKAIPKIIDAYRFIRKHHTQILVSYHEGSDMICAGLGILTRTPVCISSRRDMGYKLKNRHFLIYRIINRAFDAIITVSDAVRKMIHETQRAEYSKLTTIYNGVDGYKFRSSYDIASIKKKYQVPPANAVVGIIAALRPIKGHQYLLKAAKNVLHKHPNVTFLIVGWYSDTDPYYQELTALTAQLGIKECVIFTGGIANIAEVLSAIDVSVLTSLNEGFSNAVLESMAAGKPIVATRSGGTPEAVVEGETGMLVPPGDSKSLAEALCLLLDNPALVHKMGENARKRATEVFSYERMMDETVCLYERLLSENRAKKSKVRKPLKTNMKRLFDNGMVYSGISFLVRKHYRRISILSYHRVLDDEYDPLCMSISRALFEEQVSYMKSRCALVSLKDAISMLSSDDHFPEHAIALTFDDGYQDNFTNVFPILRKYAVPATIFLTAGIIETGGVLWFDRVTGMIRYTETSRLDLKNFGYGEYRIGTFEGKYRATLDIVNKMKYLHGPKRIQLLERLQELLGQTDEQIAQSYSLLTWDQARIMASAGISFGSHGMSHSILTTLAPDELDNELLKSRECITKQILSPVDLFAFPNGRSSDFNSSSSSALARCGYKAAFTLIPNARMSVFPFAIGRHCISTGMLSYGHDHFSKTRFESEIVRNTLF
jgi:glycosyltransferase involved in cell wall biosynthesis/peptidoglycan/xylan/chitin deacetylase (PgdA/CDA1 family)